MAEAASKVTPIRPPVEENVWTALAKAQAEFPPLGKTTQGQRSKYAPLDEAIDKLRPVLNKHGLTPSSSAYITDGQMTLKRKLVHGASGTEMEIDWPIGAITKTPQEIGSASTYARRYSLLAICEVFPCDEDDDGEKGGQHSAPRQQPAQARKAEPKPLAFDADRMEATLTAVSSAAELEAWKAANRQFWPQLSPAQRSNFKAAVDALDLKFDEIPV